MRMNDLDYREDTEIFRGLIAYDDTASGKQPGVLVFHEGLGLGEHIIERTRRVAKLGYVALAADMFGDRRQARDLEDRRRLVGDLRNDPTSSARVVVRRLQRLRHSRKSTLESSVR
jgi:dienelactone hydrolase